MDAQEKARQVADHLRLRAEAEAREAARRNWPLPLQEQIQEVRSRLAAGEPCPASAASQTGRVRL